MKDGIIKIDSYRGKKFGFESDKFGGYLWKDGDKIIISTIESFYSGKRHLKQLFDNIESKGFKIIVPTPSTRMEKICLKRDMEKIIINEYECMVNK